MKIFQIVEGHINKAIKDTPLASKQLEDMAALRMHACEQCRFNNQPCLNASKQCCKCGCNMEAKTRALNAKCPLGKW